MRTLAIAPYLLMAALFAAPAAGQGVPDNIPDRPGESLADRQKERMAERYRGVLGRFFTGGSFAVAPVSRPAWQLDTGLGYTFRSGDALLLSAGVRAAPLSSTASAAGWNEGAWLAGLAYEVHGTRFFGASPLGWRTALGAGVGVMAGDDITAVTFTLVPTYALVTRPTWSLPVGLNLSVAGIDSRAHDARLTRTFLGVSIGVRWHLVGRSRLDRTD